MRLGLFGLLALVVVLASRPADASKKRSKRSTSSDSGSSGSTSSGKSAKDDEKASGDDEGDGDEKPAPKPAPSKEAPEPRGNAAPLGTGSGLPEWREGTGWTVKTVYRKLPVKRAGKNVKPEELSVSGWSEPTYWSFLVKKVKGGGGITQYLLQVRNKDGGKAALASLYLARYPMGPATDVMALTRGKFYTMMSGLLKPTTRPYVTPGQQPHPVLAEDSVIPYDVPALPFQAKAPPGVKETELARTFSFTEDLDGQKVAREVTQVEIQNTTLDAFGGKELTEYIKSKGWATTDLSYVELRRNSELPKVKQVVKQVWSPKLPWYLYSETPSMRSWLWDLEAPKPEPSPTLPSIPSPIPSATPSATPSPSEN